MNFQHKDRLVFKDGRAHSRILFVRYYKPYLYGKGISEIVLGFNLQCVSTNRLWYCEGRHVLIENIEANYDF